MTAASPVAAQSADTTKPENTPSAAAAPAAPAPAAPTSDPAKGEAPATTPTGDATKTTAGTGSSLIPHDLSPYGMFMNADVVVKAVMIGLAFASVVTWTVLIAKLIELMGARGRAKRALDQLAAAPSLRDAAEQMRGSKTAVARFVAAALTEADQSQGLPSEGVKERAAALLARLEARAGRDMGRGTGVLATIGSTAPFVGLFGTVWGIMNSFIGISKTNTTNLAVVAPGIAEALLATAFGLIAAIPAVVIYNFFARNITGYRSILGDASTEIMRLLSRDLDRAESHDGRIMPMGRAAE